MFMFVGFVLKGVGRFYLIIFVLWNWFRYGFKICIDLLIV